jgi:hypothetical protein
MKINKTISIAFAVLSAGLVGCDQGLWTRNKGRLLDYSRYRCV